MLTNILKEAVSIRVTNFNVNRVYKKYVEVESSNVHSFYYDNGKQILRTRFLNGTEYEYYRVPPRVFIYLLNAPSHGKEFWARVRNIFQYKRIAD